MEPSQRKRIVIADDFARMLDAVERRLAIDYDVVGKALDGVELVEYACRLRPDLMVVDFAMPRLNGIDALRHLRSIGIEIPSVILTMHEDEDLAPEARSVGAQGFVIKSRLETDLRLAVEEVLAGRSFTSEPLSHGMRRKGKTKSLAEVMRVVPQS